ncbi:MAG: TIGR03032 family protein [Sumerlaeia bacterium]
MTDQQAPATPQQPPRLEVFTSRNFIGWLASQQASLAFTTYQTGKVFFIGLKPPTPQNPQPSLSIFERTLERVMGMTVSQSEIYLSTLYQLWRFRDALLPSQSFNGYDRVYVPRESRVTGDIDVHDMAVTADGTIVFVNTLFNCLATIDDDHSFRPIWKPPWISKLAAEDRCHLNGMALRDGKPRYVTAVSRSDVADGWRDRRASSGIVFDIEAGEAVCEGLSMPHSPRWHNGTLYVLNSGTGWFGSVDLEKKAFEPIAFCPGYARGMAFHNGYAIIGLSDRRENRTFQDLPLEDNLKDKDAETRCGLMVVDLATGDAPHWLRMEGIVKELYDVCVIPGAIRPMAIGFKSDEIRRYISCPPGVME